MKLVFFLLSLSFSTILLGKGGFSIYAGSGIIYYQGDLKQTSVPDIHTSHIAGKMGIAYSFFDVVEVKAQYIFGQISGNDNYTVNYIRGVKFKSPVNEISLYLKLNLNSFMKKRTWDIYLQGGMGEFTFNPTTTYMNSNSYTYLPEDDFTSPQMSYLFGMGITKWVSRHWGIAIEGTYRKTVTDYIDGISINGNPNRNDAFIDMTAVMIYRIIPKKKDNSRSYPSDCPSF